ncbi:hypothetical protein [Herbaspirillum sp. ST 5-3]|uniref:hypothetical protein n=1 Tax=Oxalobacteraceae TaxID=75682 RepID=UPI001B3C1387|nr:hypothetical protein [Herbaspirillum sp. ST 5-3]
MSKERQTSALRRAMLRRLALAGAAGSGMLALLREAIASGPEGGMRNIKGEVHVDGKPATLGQTILPGQTVTTGAGGEAVFVIGKDAFLQREDSSFRIEREAGVVVLRYLSGKILSVFGKGRKKLITPTATIGIRGTACYIEAEEARTYFCLCYGHAVLTPFADIARPRVLRTSHHERPLYIGMEKSAITRAHVVNHRDAELIMLEALVGRRPPFYGKPERTY